MTLPVCGNTGGLSLADLSLSLACASASCWQHSLAAGAQGVVVGDGRWPRGREEASVPEPLASGRDETLGSRAVAGKCPFSVKGQLQGGPCVAMGELGFLSDQRKWAGARQTWGVSESVACSLLSLIFGFSQ